MNKTIKLTEQEFSELLSNAWSDGCNAQANRGGYCLAVEQKLVDPGTHKFPDECRIENRKPIYINQQIDKYFPSSKPITTPVMEMTSEEDEPKYKMDLYFSVFNCHVNNASERAKKDVITKFGKAEFNEKIKPLIDNGIMAMFKESPTEITKYFAEQITEYVNEDRVEKTKEENEYVS